jgi:hypothetical protein
MYVSGGGLPLTEIVVEEGCSLIRVKLQLKFAVAAVP